MKPPKTLQEAIVYFADPDRAFEFAAKLRWPDGKVICPRCSSDSHYFIKTRKLWLCRGCDKQFTLKVNTIFEDSAVGLDKWMTAFWMLVNCKNGVSSMEIHRTIGVTQKTAWFMLQRLRAALHNRTFGSTKKIGGPDTEVEVDETFVGGKVKNMHRSRRERFAIQDGFAGASTGKTIVQGILDRNLRQVRATVVPNVKRETLQSEILKQVKYGTKVYTGDAVAYEQGLQARFVHDFVNKTETYVRGRVHVNGMENFWSLLKRGLRGTYVAVEPFHLFRYVDEQVFRFNNRKDGDCKLTDADRFARAMSQVAGRRLTYSELTGKDTDSLHTSETRAGETEVPF
ncbi:MAG TPA: IS1595 family transposase [Terriglobales bacterium]|nr:IS1595 family transposase [Terriglobales bacterium]